MSFEEFEAMNGFNTDNEIPFEVDNPTDGFEMGDAISLDSLLSPGPVQPSADAKVDEEKSEEPKVEPSVTTEEDGFVKGEALSLDELVNEVEDDSTKDIKEEEPTVTESDDSEPTPTINLFANMFGGLV